MNDENTAPIDGDLADSIAMLEQILEVMPQDPIALKALYNAYVQAGKQGSAFAYLERLVQAAADGDDSEIKDFAREQLIKYEETDADKVSELRQIIKGGAVSYGEDATTILHDEPDFGSTSIAAERDINEELALAWRLYEENQLSQEEYASILHDLTEMSSKKVDVPVSVLHVLNDRGFTQMNRIINYMSSRSGVPYLHLTQFELDQNAAELLPEETYFRDGALPFGFLGEDLLVGVLNPYHMQLQDTVERLSKRRCHTFLVGPEQYDEVLKGLRKDAAK